MADKNVNYTEAQEAIIRKVAAENGGVLNLELSKRIAAMPEMNKDGQPRSARMITAKIKRMDIPYQNKQPTRKDGSPIQKKADLVARLATLADVQAAALSGLDSSPRSALETLVTAFETALDSAVGE